MKATIYTDGGCYPNPGHGGWGAIILYNGMELEIYGGETPTTSNRMELMAIIEGINKAIELGADDILIRSDSMYCCKTINLWMEGWHRNDYIRNDEKIPNDDLIEKIYQLSAKVKIEALWIKSHAGDEYNERADKLASLYRNEKHESKYQMICSSDLWNIMRQQGMFTFAPKDITSSDGDGYFWTEHEIDCYIIRRKHLGRDRSEGLPEPDVIKWQSLTKHAIRK